MNKAQQIYMEIEKNLLTNDLSIGEINSILQALTTNISNIKVNNVGPKQNANNTMSDELNTVEEVVEETASEEEVVEATEDTPE